MQNQIKGLEKIIQPFVYRRYLDYGVIDSLRSMHAQIRAEVIRQETRHPERSNNVKLGRGGIRELEFLSQVFQLIRGGPRPSRRHPPPPPDHRAVQGVSRRSSTPTLPRGRAATPFAPEKDL